MSQSPEEPVDPQTLSVTDAKLVDLLKRGEKLDAIIEYRSIHNVGLAEAKRGVEAFAEKHGIAMAPDNPAAGRLVMAAGCIFVLLFVGVIAVVLAMSILT